VAQDPENARLSESASAGVPLAAVPSAQINDDLLGTVYLGKYELNAVLGVGGMGVIYQGRQIFLDRIVAVKMLKNNQASAKARTRFHQEAKAASALRHPGIVSILDFGVDKLDRPYMVMEYVEGWTLSDLLEERLTLTVEDLLPIFLEICDALAVAHKKGIIHRDLKPNNIMLIVGDDGNVRIKILDFGVAKMADMEDRTFQDLTKTGVALGTPLYMSPEQVKSKDIDNRADLYSLGCMLYTCLTGAPPFIGENKIATMEMHCSEAPLLLKEASYGMDFPPGIEPIVMKLLEKKPEDRYGSVMELKEALISMAARNGMLPELDISPGSRHGSYLDTLLKMSTVVSEAVRRSATSQTLPSPNDAAGEADGRLSDVGGDAWKLANTKNNAVSEKGKAPDRKEMVRPVTDRSVPRRRKPNVPGESRPASRIEASLNKTFATIGLALVALALAVAGGIIFLFASTSHKTQFKTQPPKARSETRTVEGQSLETALPEAETAKEGVDAIIHHKLMKGAVEQELNFANQSGLTEKGLKELAAFKYLRGLDLSGTGMKDGDVTILLNLPLKYLSLRKNAGISDAALNSLSQMKTLQELSLDDTRITDRGLIHVSRLPALRVLSIGANRRITEQGIKNLVSNKCVLTDLFLDHCDINDSAGEDFRKITKLKNLDLSYNPRIADKTIVSMQKQLRLEELILSDTKIGELAIKALTSYKSLRKLDLCYTALSRGTIADLETMKGLTHLYLRGSSLLPAEIEKLRHALPNTKISASTNLEHN